MKTSFTDVGRGNPSLYADHKISSIWRIQYGAGLTLNDWYALNYWEGEQYQEITKFRDARGSFALGTTFHPIPLHPQYYIGLEQKFRTYYSADEDFFHAHSGYWIGAKRKESDSKLKIGFTKESVKGFVFDFGLGVVYMNSNDKWAKYYPSSQSQEATVKSGKETVSKILFCVDVQIGFGNKKY